MAPVNKEQLVQSAEKNVARGKLDLAIKEYERVLEESPRDASTLNRIGDLWLRLNKVEEAKRVFARTAFVYIEDGFLVKAIAMYKKIIKCDPTGIDAYERLADLYHRQGLVNEARTQYQVLADYHQKHGNSTAAAAMLERLVELEPDSPGHRARLAELYQLMGAVDRSLAERRAIADLLLERKHEDEAVKVLMTAFALRPEDLEFVADTVQSLRARGYVGPAARFLAQVCERNPAAQELVIRRLGGAALAPSGPAPAAPAPARPLPAVEPAPPAATDPAVRFAEGAPALATDAWAFPAPPVASTAAPLPEVRLEPAPAPAPAPAQKPRLRVEGDPNPPLPKPKRPPAWGGEMPPPDVTFSFEPLTVEELAPHDPLAGSPSPASAKAAPKTDFADLDIEIEIEGHSEADGTDWRDLAEPVQETAVPVVEAPTPTQAGRGMTPLELGAASVAADEIAGAHSKTQRVEELIAEAEVLAKYGLVGRALERLRDLVRREPGQAEAYRAMIEIHFEQGRRDRVAEVATQWLTQVGGIPQGSTWRETRDRLESEGFRIQGRTVLPPDGQRTGDGGRPSVDSLLRDLVKGKAEPAPRAAKPSAPPEPKPPAAKPPAPTPIAAAPVVAVPEPVKPPPAATPAPEPASAAPKKKRLSLADIDLNDLNATLSMPQKRSAPAPAKPAAPPQVAPPPAAPIAPPPPVAAAPPPPVAAPPPSTFSFREDSFAELDFEDLPPTAVRPPISEPEGAVGQRPSAFASAPVPEPAIEEFQEAPPAASPPAVGIRKTSEPLHTADWLDLGDLASPWTEIPEVAARTDGASSTFAGELLTPLPPLDTALPPPVLRSTAQDLFEDTAVSWLDSGDAKQETAEKALFDDEGEFFDLAAELEKELATENAKRAANVEPEVKEQTLEEIVESFKKGVAENLPAEDYDTHFNLGIAYREMGLVDEAIGEFQLAAKAPQHFLDCCSLLGLCFLEKGLPELAVKWYRRALEVPGLTEDQLLALQYELANALTVAGERDAAYKAFVDIYGSNSHFRDVVMRIAELKPR
jgi:tetratricopeptide (TPR) repeat protein